MTRAADFKRLVRARMHSTGENYTTALAVLLRQKEVPMIPCTVRVHIRSEEEIADARAKLEAYAAEHDVAVTERDLEMLGLATLLLEETGGSRRLRIMCVEPVATAIQWALEGVKLERPMTHDMLRDVITAMGTPQEVRITEIRETTFFAELQVIDKAGARQTVSCRPSDGIALAVRAGIPILVAEELLSASPDASAG